MRVDLNTELAQNGNKATRLRVERISTAQTHIVNSRPGDFPYVAAVRLVR